MKRKPVSRKRLVIKSDAFASACNVLIVRDTIDAREVLDLLDRIRNEDDRDRISTRSLNRHHRLTEIESRGALTEEERREMVRLRQRIGERPSSGFGPSIVKGMTIREIMDVVNDAIKRSGGVPPMRARR